MGPLILSSIYRLVDSYVGTTHIKELYISSLYGAYNYTYIHVSQ